MNKRELSQLERVTTKQLSEVKITPFWLMINSEYGIGITSHNSIRFNRNCMKRLIDIFNTEAEKTSPAANTEETTAIMETKEEPKELAQESIKAAAETAEATPTAESKESRRGKRGKQKKPVKVPFLLKAEPEIMAKIEELAESSEQSKTAIIEKALNSFFAESERESMPEIKKAPEQTWTFTHDDLQEQARLIERLTVENQQLSAELQIANRKQPPINQEALKDKIATLETQLNNAEHSAEERGKKWHLEQKKARKLQDEKEFMQERITFLLSEIENLKALKDKRGFISNAKNGKEKSFLEKDK